MKKKFISFVMAFMLLLVGGFTLAGCDEVPADPTTPPAGEVEPTHTHEYVGDLYYTVKDNKAYSYSKCECGEKGEETEVVNAVIVTPETAQDVLDEKYGEINGKTLVFNEGTYDTELVIRPSKYDAVAYEYLGTGDNFYVLGDKVEDLTTLVKLSRTYHYLRSVSNLTFAGTENAKFTAPITFSSRYYYENTLGNPSVGVYDAVREIWCNEATSCGYMNHLAMTNLEFSRLNFEGTNGIIDCYVEQQITDSYINNITVNNCTFIAEQPNSSSMAAFRMTGEELVYSNVEFRNNFVDGHFQGTYVINTTNAVYENNVIQNTKHNAFAIQSQGGKYFTGNVIIRNNIIENIKGETDTGERAIRFGVGKNANIVVENNTFKNAVDGDNELVKTQVSTNTNYQFKNNTYNENILEEQNGILNNTSWIIVLNEE